MHKKNHKLLENTLTYKAKQFMLKKKPLEIFRCFRK